jgi:hypothetical protein
LSKRRNLDDKTCLFCNELESVSHLFFECCVAQCVWGEISELSDKVLGADFESVARFWVADNKHKALNVCAAAVLWAIWKLRNECCFQGTRWEGVQVLLRKIGRMIRDWRLLNKPEVAARLEEWARDLEMRSGRPPRLVWRDENHVVTLLGSAVGSDGHDAVSSELVSLESLAVNVGMDDRVRLGGCAWAIAAD